jgi:hypothetical protein
MWDAIRIFQWVYRTRVGSAFIIATLLAAIGAIASLWSWKVPGGIGALGMILGICWGLVQDVRDDRERHNRRSRT